MSSPNSTSPVPPLPPSLDLSPHLSAQKYFYVCTLTVLAWDTLVLTPRAYRLGRTKACALKALYYFLQIWVLADFVVTGVMFFSTSVKQDPDCRRFWPYEPICTAILLFAASSVHVIRVKAIYDHSPRIRNILLGLLCIQGVVTAICCGFYRSVHLLDGQGCIAGPLNNQGWVGIYWLAPTILYATTFSLALARSIQSLETKRLHPWRLMLRDSLNLYGAILIVNLANVLFYFIMTPTDNTDPIKTIVTSMAAVLTATMSMRIILGVKGSLENGGKFDTSGSGGTSGGSGSLSANGVARGRGAITYTINDMSNAQTKSSGAVRVPKEPAPWDTDNSVDAVPGRDAKVMLPIPGEDESDKGVAVQVTVDQQVAYDDMPRRR